MSRLHTVSLRRRVTVTAILVLAVVLIVLGFVVNAVFRVQAERDVRGLLAGRVQLAQQLAKQNVSPANLVRRVETRGIRASVTLPTGEPFGAPNIPPDTQLRQVKATLSGPARINGAELVLSADTALLAGAERSLQQVLLITGLSAIVVTALALLIGVRFALAPLDAMTGLAKSIVSGGRGGRLAPTRTDTELGRTAAAFDAMLDALEGAESTARGSEERTRRFLADAAHELRTPIAGVQAAAEAVLRQSADADPERRERLHLLLVREARRAGQLVSDLLELARLDAGVEVRREPVQLLALVGSQADRARLLAPELTVEVSGTDIEIRGDGDRITGILANLVDNARHAMASVGVLTLDVARSGRCAEVLVTDTGPGVPPADRDRIFDRLVRLDDARDRRGGSDPGGSGPGGSVPAGSGLGLAIARGLARAHGGELCYQDRVDGKAGAVFRLLLPTGDDPVEPIRIS